MSWSELERFVDEAETDEVIRRGLRHCRSGPELILAARRLGYHVTRVDLQRAWQLHRLGREPRPVPAGQRPAPGG
ncbi:nitrogen fixation protein [Cyanobium sp. Copco_Reservoir_LC18]|uniref:Nif11-like leader peptide family natural product precursor n=1 Tax=Cyanobium sp. Copco_Reservoir_LC18 TaxID=1328305 RepID=UPI00135A23CA|nr:Nif11-like leader peptide family natural product precursor [Cyanobium sp. Copco_Reservoir_LC18]KAF0654612.1 nitrogen fixation protein [Cyanobium sp. Copco_Reservoir_LC18]